MFKIIRRGYNIANKNSISNSSWIILRKKKISFNANFKKTRYRIPSTITYKRYPVFYISSISLNNDIFLIPHSHTLCYFISSRKPPPLLHLLVPSFSGPHCLPFVYLPRFPRISYTILSVLRRSFSFPIVVSTPDAPPSCRYAADGNPRCPSTDTNGYLCQRRNLLLYIPLYKQRVNRAHTLRAPRTGGRWASPVSLSLSFSLILPRPFNTAQQVQREYVMETDLSIVPP